MSLQAETSATIEQHSALHQQLIKQLEGIVGKHHLLTEESDTRRYRTGFRFGQGSALAVVRPGSLIEQWQVLQACVAANVIIISQASNTGLTGGSTPDGNDYDRPIVIVSTSRMKNLYLIDEGKQVVCLPGATLDQLEHKLKPLQREPHSVIGSSCIGASVFGGVCNNSGGALVQRGPAYTELSVFARVDDQGQLHLENHLGIELGTTPEEILKRLDAGQFSANDIQHPQAAASDHHYAQHVRDIDQATPARFNADPSRLYESSGSAGKVMVFAVRLDTFPMEKNTKVFYIGTNDTQVLTQIRRNILGDFTHLPISGEYLHRVAFDIAAKYGKDTFIMIDKLGTSRLPAMFALKNKFDAFCDKLGFLPQHFSDHLLQAVSRLFPNPLPTRMMEYRDKYQHHLLLKVSEQGYSETREYLEKFFQQAEGGYFECDADEGRKAFLHRFAAAGAAVRYRTIHHQQVEDIVALDIALRRNDTDWLETLPNDIENAIEHKLYYGHFLCYVFHQDYIVKKGHDCLDLEHRMWKLLDNRGAEYPAEHNVGHLYHAKPALKDFYQQLDPCNCFNAGVGKMSKHTHYRDTK
jgi:D-lactate dehydrogenase